MRVPRSALGAAVNRVSLVVFLLFFTSSAAQGFGISVSVAPTNGGLVGIRAAAPVVQKYFRSDSLGVERPVDGYSRVIRNTTFSWRPAISTGLLFRFASPKDSLKCRWGVGAHFVVFEDGQETRTAPAITLNFGTERKQVFAGLLFTATDDLEFPRDPANPKHRRSEVVVPTEDADSFVAKRVSSRANFYAGVVFPVAL